MPAKISNGLDPRRVTYLPLEDVKANPRNPKGHDLGTIETSIGRFGVLDLMVLDERTGQLVSGHGRLETLTTMQAAGESPPDGVIPSESGRWLVPVVTGWASRSDTEAAAALIALNRSSELGGWLDEPLLALLDDLAQQDALDGVGYGQDEIDDLRGRLAGIGDGEPERQPYTAATNVPQYTPTQPEPPPVTALLDRAKTAELEAEIRAAEDVPDDVREYLLAAAQRHTVFRYDQAAEFYAHAPPHVQTLMEASALVIIDVDDAIARGYVQLSTRLDELLAAAREDGDDAE